MAASLFYISQGNTLPAITATLVDQYGVPANLTGASVYFHMTNFFFGNVVNSAATVVNAATGQVSYSWKQADTTNPGLFSCEWYVVFPSGAQETYPQGYYNQVQISVALNNGFPGILQSQVAFNTINSSSSAPTSVNGNNGDYWYNTTNGYFYGPKANGVWPAGTLLNYASVPLNNLTPPTGNVNMNGYGFTNLASISAQPSSTTVVPGTFTSPSGSTVDIVDINVGATTVWRVNSAGALVGSAGYAFTAQGGATVSSSATGTSALSVNSPTGTTVPIMTVSLNGTPQWTVGTTGALSGVQPLSVSPTSLTAVPGTFNIPASSTADALDVNLAGTTYWKVNSSGNLLGIGQLNVAPTAVGTVPLVVSSPSGATVDAFDVNIAGTKTWYVASTGILNGVQPLSISTTAVGSLPLTVNAPTGVTANVADFRIAGTSVLSVNSTGNLAVKNSQQIDLSSASSTSPFIGVASTPWTPVWTASAGTPAIGNGTLTGRYIKTGRMVYAQIQLNFGTTTTLGTASCTWNWSLPFTPATSVAYVAGSSFMVNNAGASFFSPSAVLQTSAGTVSLYYPSGGTTTSATWAKVGNLFFTWTLANTTYIDITIVYEATS